MAKVLLGFMGAGKSTIARNLASDSSIWTLCLKNAWGCRLLVSLEEKGEVAFRQVEEEVLADLLKTDQVVSTGGGVVISQKNRALLKQNPDNIYLKADLRLFTSEFS